MRVKLPSTVVVALGLLVLLAGCGGTKTVTRTVTVSPYASTTPIQDRSASSTGDNTVPTECAIGDHGSSVVIDFSGPGAEGVCAAYIKAVAKGGSYWSTTTMPQANDTTTNEFDSSLRTVCLLAYG